MTDEARTEDAGRDDADLGEAGTDDDTTDDTGTDDDEGEDSRIEVFCTEGASAIINRKRGKIQLSVTMNHIICLINRADETTLPRDNRRRRKRAGG